MRAAARRGRCCRRAARTSPASRVLIGGQPGGAQHGGHAGERHHLVLRRERVDRGRDHPHLRPSRPSQAYVGREKTKASARSTYGIRNCQARAPGRWACPGRCAPARSPARPLATSGGIIPAVWGSWSSTTSLGPSRRARSSASPRNGAHRPRARLAQPAAIVGPCRRLWSRLVTRKTRVAADHHPASVQAGAAP